MGDFQPLEVVDRGSETQPQVVANLNKLTLRDNDITWCFLVICLSLSW